ncbi:ABC transporter permease [Lawsonibacter celer]|uniref:ABC transporter permease n=1 Tax=Lawsonibacter celer TaxID=2986526 RepID=UPI0016447CF5|nr:ABC transporter permease [Lawsonibacter celer]
MIRFIIKRLLTIIPMMLVIIFIVFALVSMSKVDPGRMKLGADASEEDVYAYNESLGLHDPLIVRYGKYVVGILKGDFGVSYYYNEPVMDIIMGRWPYTIKLTLLSMAIALAAGISLGVLSAVKQYSILDRIATVASMLLSAVPTFCMAALLVLTFSYKFGLVPASGVTNGWKSWILPAITLGISYSAQFLRFTRSTMLDTTRQDYIRTARAKGVAERTMVWRHAFRNALLPLITISGTTMGALLGGAVAMEKVFVIPGLGTLVQDALNRNDVPLVIGAITLMAFTFMMIMLVVDLLYAAVDPRIRAKYSGGKVRKTAKKETAHNG